MRLPPQGATLAQAHCAAGARQMREARPPLRWHAWALPRGHRRPRARHSAGAAQAARRSGAAALAAPGQPLLPARGARARRAAAATGGRSP